MPALGAAAACAILPPFTMADEAITRHRGSLHTGVAHASPYPTSRLAPVHDLVDAARQIAEADAMLGAVANAKLQVIAEQIRSLQAQAREVLETANRDAALHRASCNFRRRPGAIYHLYERPDGTQYFSMLGPAEWGTPPHPFMGSYELQLDMGWRRRPELEPGA